MNELFTLIQAHPVYWTAFVMGSQHVFAAAIDSLPPPKPMASPFYEFLFTFGNKLAGNYRQKEKTP